MDDTIEKLRHQKNMLADGLGNLLIAMGMIRPDTAMTGPELLLAAETAAEHAAAERLQSRR